MALIAADVGVPAFEGPAREAMVEPVLVAAGPADLGRVPADVLDVAPAAIPPLVLATMEALPCADAAGELRVAAQTRGGAHAASLGVATIAFVVALEVGVVA